MVNLEKTSYLAKQKFSALIFGEDHPYANRIEESDYQRITVSLIRDFYHRYYQAGQFRIFICGHVNEGLLNTVTRLFGNLPIPSPGNISKKLPFHAAQPGRYHVSKENCVQSSIRIGKSSVRLTDDDYAGYMLLNTILGGYFGSRLMSNIREEKGYTYGIGSFNVSLPQRSYWSITTEVNNEYTEATIEEIFKEIHKLRTETDNAPPKRYWNWPTNIGTLKRCISSLPDNLNLPGKGQEIGRKMEIHDSFGIVFVF